MFYELFLGSGVEEPDDEIVEGLGEEDGEECLFNLKAGGLDLHGDEEGSSGDLC